MFLFRNSNGSVRYILGGVKVYRERFFVINVFLGESGVERFLFF